jgi:hypothetical protein
MLLLNGVILDILAKNWLPLLRFFEKQFKHRFLSVESAESAFF